jgi:putative transposase
MGTAESLSHTRWECKYHLVWIPKCRRKVLFGQLRKHLGEVLHDLAFQKESRILEGHLQADHVHMLVSIPPKYSVAQVVGFIKGKSAIHIARTYLGRRRNYHGMHFWARGYYVSTVGAMKRACVLTSRNRRWKTHGWISSNCSVTNDHRRWSDNLLNHRFERFIISSHRLCRWS